MYSQTILTAGAVFIFGTIIMVLVPGVSGVWSIAAISITASAAFIFFGRSTEDAIGIMLAAFVLEIFAGLPLGVYLASIAIAMLMLTLAGSIIQIEPLKDLSRIEPPKIISGLAVAYVLSLIISIVSYLIMSLAYGYVWSWASVIRELISVRVFIETALSLLFIWGCWRAIQNAINLRHNKW